MSNIKKFYTEGWMALGVYVGGPLAGIYYLAENFEALEDKDSAKKTYKIGIVLFLIILAAVLFVDDELFDALPKRFIPFLYLIVTLLIYEKYQKKLVLKHLKESAVKVSGWTAIGVSCLCLIITIGVYLLAIVLYQIFFS